MSDLSFMSFHPYGNAASDVMSYNAYASQQLSTYNSAHSSHQLSLLATEWGTNNPGSQQSWAAQVNQAFTGSSTQGLTTTSANSVRDTYETSYYYQFADEHTGSNHEGQSLLDEDSTNSTLDPEPYFYSMYQSWANGNVTGKVFTDTNGNGTLDAGESGIASRTVYIDVNKDGSFDSGDLSAVTDSSGNYTINYSLLDGSSFVPSGNYTLAVTPSGSQPAVPSQQIHVDAALTTALNLASPGSAPATGSISGVYWGDDNGNGVKDSGESGQSGKTMYLDLNNDGSLDNSEPSAMTGSDGSYSFTGLAAGNYYVRRSGLPSGYRFTTPANGYYYTTLTAGQAVTGDDFLVTSKSSITGVYFGDNNGDGVMDNGETGQSGKTMYLDLNNDGSLDNNEPTSITGSDGTYEFDNLTAGTYYVRRSGLPAGYHLTTPSNGVYTINLATATLYSGANFGVEAN